MTCFYACEIFSLKKINRFKIVPIPHITILLTYTPLNLPMESYLYTLVFIYDHLWESLLFMRIFLNLFLFMIICENLSLLWESFWISSYLWSSVKIFFFLWESFESVLICDYLWESLFFSWESFWIFLIYDNLCESIF